MKRLTDIDRYWEGEEFWRECMESDAEDIDKIYNRLAAIEDIQVAAMCRKFTGMEAGQ